jgi:cytochrome c oxidase subunit 3
MNIVVASVALVAGILVWWMIVRQLTTKPWQAQGSFDGRDAASQLARPPAARVGLWVFLAVATSFFALFISAYLMRMNPELENGMSLKDWRPVAEPWILWVNTALLMAGSAGMQLASSALRRHHFERASTGMLAGGVFAILFLGGQYLAWRQLQAAGYYADGNPANAFFYVLTGLHGLHLLGGLCVLGWATVRMSRERVSRDATRLSVELCTVYWHYLLIIWLILFGLLLIT